MNLRSLNPKALKAGKVAAILAATAICPAGAAADNSRAALQAPALTNPAAEAALKDITETLGIVPDFFKAIPLDSLPAAWLTMKQIQLNPNSAIPPKYKELLGLAVASQIPCHYCTFFHTSAAKLNGATDGEIKEAVAIGALERQWSTIINGSGMSTEEVRSWADSAFDPNRPKVNEPAASPATGICKPLDSVEAVNNDIQAMFGSVPAFVNHVPKQGLPAAWAELKCVLFNPSSEIPAKYKDMIMLSVSAQVPCPSCIYLDRKAAAADGATPEEIDEAVATASIVRHWSTVLNGSQTKEAAFQKQVTQVMAYVKKAMDKNKAQPK